MFIKDGKTLFGNRGFIVALLIMLVFLMVSYNKCVKGVELFVASPTLGMQKTPEPSNFRISITGNSIVLNFTLETTNSEPLPKKVLVVLAQYDSSLKNTGNNKFYLSNEYELNADVSSSETTYKTNLCTLINGMPSCKYVFSNLDTVDANGKLYYYKIGISAVYDWGNSKFVMPYNVNSGNNLFSLDTSIEQQETVYNEFLQYKQQKKDSNQQNVNNMMASADGQYELIKSQLGNYPSNLIMDPTSAKQNLLNDLVDKSMAQGLLNVNVKLASK